MKNFGEKKKKKQIYLTSCLAKELLELINPLNDLTFMC